MILDLTIAIPVRNEEKNLPGCLNSIGKEFAKRIVIIDSGSTDNTTEIAKSFGAEVVNFVWNGKFPKKRNWFLRNHSPDTKWILFLDADEHLTENFKNELVEKLNQENNVGYWLRYTIYFMGEKLRGGYPLKKLALFRIGYGEYEQIDEENWSKLDMEIHEHPVLKGEIGVIKHKIDHLDFRDVTHYITKHNEYASWEAKRFLSTSINKVDWTWKQRLKYRLMSSVWISPAFFFGSYFLLGGFRDGSRGIAFAILKMSYFNQIYCKVREQKDFSKFNKVT